MSPDRPPTTVADLSEALREPYPRDAVWLGLDTKDIIVVPSQGQVLFRLVSEPMRERDFEPRTKPRYADQPLVLHRGISMFRTAELAEERARRTPKHIAQVTLPPDVGLTLARTFPHSAGHYTVWGEADVLLANASPVG
jgi:hypothetical protein